MTTTIYYLVDKQEKFHFFDNFKEAKAKEEFFSEKYGLFEVWKGCMIPPIPIQYKSLKNYYGTVWLATKDSCYVLQGRWKDIKEHRKWGYKIRKIVITEYNDFITRFKGNDEVFESYGEARTGL